MAVTLHGPTVTAGSLATGAADSAAIANLSIINEDISASAAIAGSKLQALVVGTNAGVIPSTGVADAHVAAAAAVAGSKLQALTVGTNAGVIPSTGVADAHVAAAAAIAGSKLQALTVGTNAGVIPSTGIADAHVAAAAAIGGSKLQALTVGTNAGVLPSTGVADAHVAAGAAIALSKLAALTSGQIVVGSATNVPTAVAMSGNVAISNAGVTTIQAAAVQDSMLASSFNKDGGRQAVGYVDFTGAGADTQTVTINSRVYELDTHIAQTITGNVRVNVSGGGTVKAAGTLTLAANAANGETVTIDSKVYTFQLVLTDVNGNVLIGGDASTTIDNLIDAINLGPTAGSDYAASMTLHPTVSAAAGAGDTMVATAKAGGTAGNSLATTETLAAAGSQWNAATLGTTTAGVDPTAAECATAFTSAVNADASRVVDAYNGGVDTVLLIAKAAGATNYALAEALGNGVVSAAAMTNAAAAAVRTAYANSYAVTAADVTVTTGTNGTIIVAGIPSTTAPSVWLVQGRSSTGVLKALANCQFTWRQANSNFYALELKETQNGATDLAASDTISVIVIV